MGDNRNADSSEIAESAARLGVPVDEDQLTAITEQVEFLESLLGRLDDVDDPTPPDRDYWQPTDDEDPHAAYLTKCDIEPTGSGLLDGLTVAVKDNMAVAGVPMTVGSPLLEAYTPTADATVVRRLLSEGARIVGKMNMDEFASGGDQSSMRFRLARNPVDTDHMPGGSSSGSVVAVAEGSVDAALGSDGGGSIRAPAAWCGVVGVKPTRGLVSHYGCFQYAKNLDNHGPFARTCETAAKTLQAIAGEDVRDERTHGVEGGEYADAAREGEREDSTELTIGLPEELFGIAPELDEFVYEATGEMADNGATVREVSVPEYDLAIPAWMTFGVTEMGAYFRSNAHNYWSLSLSDPSLSEALSRALDEDVAELGESVANTLVAAEYFRAEKGNPYYARAHRARQLVAEGVDTTFEDVDVLASTTMPIVAPEWGENVYADGLEDVLAATAPFNLTGHPAISVPCGTHEGLPVGMQFVAPRFGERTMFRAAAQWESIHGGDA
jgi:Asp-tRNA(Asn)/Glu-tRNA(Gln) amidotransferase A subunit family amidase